MVITQESKNKIWWRHWSVVLILAVLAGLVIWAMLNLASWLKNLQEWREARAIQEKLEMAYRDDKYGGKTPEETLGMFIAALENGDIELAGKYFVIEKQEAWIKVFATYKKQALLNNFIQELKPRSYD
jgi:hypothetical protein